MLDEHGCCRFPLRLTLTTRWMCLPGSCCADPAAMVTRTHAVLVVAVLLLVVVLVATGRAPSTAITLVSGAGVVAAVIVQRMIAATAAIPAR